MRTTLNLSAKIILFSVAIMLLLTVILTWTSTIFIGYSNNALYTENLSVPGRILLSQYSYVDVISYIDILKSVENFDEQSDRYLSDCNLLKQANGDDYNEIKQRIQEYHNNFSMLKNEKYSDFQVGILSARVATGVKYLYVVSDIGLSDKYAVICNAYYEAEKGDIIYNDFGTVILKDDYKSVQDVYDTGEPVYVINNGNGDKESGLCISYTPIRNGYDDVVAVIISEVNLASISKKLNEFIKYRWILVSVYTILTITILMSVLSKLIMNPIKELINISKAVALGNSGTEIPEKLLNKKDEIGILSRSYRDMLTALNKVMSRNGDLLNSIGRGDFRVKVNSNGLEGVFKNILEVSNNSLNTVCSYFDNLSSGVIILDSDYTIVFSNKWYNSIFSNFGFMRMNQILAESDSTDLDYLRAIIRANLEGQNKSCLRWFEIDGENRCYNFTGKELCQEDHISYILVVTDNTELVKAKDNALSGIKTKGEFLSRVSHELRTPLNAILNIAKLGLKDKVTDDSIERFNKIIKSSTYLTQLVNDILETSRMESGKLELQDTDFNLYLSLEEYISLFIGMAEDKGVKLHYEIDNKIPELVTGDEFRIKQVMLNLLSNALKFTENGRVDILIKSKEIDSEKVKLKFTVSDTGIGMSEEFLGKLFQPFEQESRFNNRKYQGTGLGLSISKKLIELMNGSIEVKSKVGEGSEFSFEIVLAIAKVSTLINMTDNTTPDVSSGILRGKRILIVDDVEINRDIMHELLKDFEFITEEATDGEKAIEKYINSPLYYYDCILMDIQMPNIDGCEATRVIRATERADNDIPIIAMTANALTEEVESILSSGMDAHVAKPIDIDTCVKKISEFLKKGYLNEKGNINTNHKYN